MEISFDKYYDYEKLTEILQKFATKYPEIFELRSIGKSHEGRDIFLAIITNKKTGIHSQKPGFWLDGNTHSIELVSSAMVLYFIDKIVKEYQQDPKIARLIDNIAFYALPCLTPDGVALALGKKPRFVRSGSRFYPYEDDIDTLDIEDIDNDGRILQMRLKDPCGDWKIFEENPKLMIKREPHEHEGTFYRLFMEGNLKNGDADIIPAASATQSLDFNRNFPSNWRPHGLERGAGEYPASEPEIHAVVDFISKHPNIYAAISYHSYSRVILRPFSGRHDDEMNTTDRWVFNTIGEMGTKLTGYPCVSVFHDFKYHPKEIICGAFDDWAFEEKGIYAYTIELWDLPTAAGVHWKNEQKKFIQWLHKHPLEDDQKILKFITEHSPEGLVDWYSFEHPQLGQVELGGWNMLYTWRNPPAHLLKAELAPQVDFALYFASLFPKLAWYKTLVEHLGNENYHITVIIENQGFFPTYTSHQALKMHQKRPPLVRLSLPPQAKLKSGKVNQEIKHLEGRSNKMSHFYSSISPTDNRIKLEWVVCAPKNTEISLCAISQCAGTIETSIELK